MKLIVENERLILRDILLTDKGAFFEMNSNAQVYKYLEDLK